MSLCRLDRPSGRFRFRPFVESLEERCLLDAAPPFSLLPVIPQVDAVMKAHLRAVLAEGARQGNQPNVFSKVGDSITASLAYLAELGNPKYDPTNPAVAGSHVNLAPTINYFRAQPVDGSGANSFDHLSRAAQLGWTTTNILSPAPDQSPLAAELGQTRPAIALVMIGTNDVYYDTPVSFRAGLGAIADMLLARGVIPVLSTLPDNYYYYAGLDTRLAEYNQIIADVAAERDVPLWNYWRALQTLPNHGISADRVHPNASPLGSGNFTDFSLAFGFNVRNLTAVEVLEELRRVVLNDGRADTRDPALVAEARSFVGGLFQALFGRPPDAGGADFWAEQVENGRARAQVVHALWQAPEHRARQVDGYYQTLLHRTADAGGETYWVGLFLAGATEEQIQEDILTSPEYLAAHNGAAALVTGLYHDVLGRDADGAGEAGWQSALGNGLRPQAVVAAFVNSEEVGTQLVQTWYTSFLRRPADPGSTHYWIGLGQGNGWQETVGEALLASEEFWQAQNG